MKPRNAATLGWLLAVTVALTPLLWIGGAEAQLPAPDTASQFDITGFLQEATLDPTCAASTLCGGTLKVNGHVVTVPKNTIVILPANALTWQELFACAPPPYGNGYSSFTPLTCGALTSPPQTGLAMADVPAPLTTYEVQAVGNKAPGTAAGSYIAGLIYISQQGLNSGQGYITSIDYTNAELNILNPADRTSSRVRINDPATVPALSGGVPNGTFTGRYSKGYPPFKAGGPPTDPDARFTVDQDNPTIASATGFPMCLPRVTATGDDLCPQGNRPTDASPAGFAGTFTMANPLTLPSGSFPDPRVQAPFEVGDYITFAGTLVQDCVITGCPGGGPTVGPWPTQGAAATYILAHTITNNIAIYTFPGTNPAYVSTNVFILGTGGTTVLGVQEATKRTRFEGMMTDPSRMIHLYGMDLPCASGTIGACDRDWGIIGVDQGPPTGAVKGRWRFRPPCAPAGTDPATIKFDKECIMNAANTFLPATREMRAVIEPLPGSALPAGWVAGQTTTWANGIIAGQYHAPILEFLFPEQIVGSPVPPANFETMPFLAAGGYSSSVGTTAPGPLNPWPGSTAPCGLAPTAVGFANPTTVFSGSGTIVTLDASATTGGSPTFLWAQNPADTTQVPLTGANTATATFTAPTVPAPGTTLNFTVTATNCAGTSTSPNVAVNVVVDVPLINHVPPVTVTSGIQTGNQIAISGVDPNGLALTFNTTQSGGAPALGNLTTTSTGSSTANITFTVPTLLLGTVTPDVVQLAITATNTGGAVSPTEFTTVTVNPQADIVTVTAAQYRISKQRLTINASDSVISPDLVLTLQPYLTTAGTTYKPCLADGGVGCIFTNQGSGLYLLDIVGAPEPAVPPATPMSITSNIPGGGTPSPFGLTSIRQ